VHEFCSGPGFIGFSLLAEGLCESLCLSDINPEAIQAVEQTIQLNGLQDCVNVYRSDGLRDIPEAERWDLVVSNPPHFKDNYHESIRHYDGNWQIHRNFYQTVAKYLNPGASVLFQENFEGSTPGDFSSMLAENGHSLIDAFVCSEPRTKNYIDTYYFQWSQMASESSRAVPKAASFIRATSGALVVDLPLTQRTPDRLELSQSELYQLTFPDHLGEGVTLLAYRLRWRFMRVFLRSLHVSDLGRTAHVRFCPGEYVLRNATTLQDVSTISVR
jgi:hypothetical protein